MNLQERDREVIWHPFTSFKGSTASIPILSGEGIYLVDENANRYIDAISSWWVNLHGHAHPYIAEKIYEQALKLEQVIFAGFTHLPAITLAERLLRILPGRFSKIFYSDNGSTSTEVAIKMALQYWWTRGENGRRKILAFNNSYHGDTFGSMSVSDRSVFTKAFHDKLFDVIFIDTPTSENTGYLKTIINRQAQEIAGFIYEPLVQGAGGMKMYDSSLLNELLETVKENDIICIADEVMTGFGRTGKLFASAYCNEKPDIICLSKGLTGGTMALGATAVTQQIVSAFDSPDKLKTFFHGHSFTANPLACTAALASLDLLEQHTCLENIARITTQHQQFLHRFSKDFMHLPIKNTRMLGTILAFEIDKGKDEYLNDIAIEITQQALEKGVYLRPLGNTVYLMPPYCITNEELEKVYNIMCDIVSTI